MKVLLEGFRKYLVGQQSLKVSTAICYSNKVKKVIAEMDKSPDQIKSLDIHQYFATIRNQKRINTQRLEQIAMIIFFRYFSQINGTPDPTIGLKLLRREGIAPAILNIDDVTLMIKACGVRNFLNIRNAAMIALLADTGIRVGELINLKVGNVLKDGNKFQLTIVGDIHGTKSYRQRTVPFAKLDEGGIVAEPWSAYYSQIKFIDKWDSEAPLFQRSAIGRYGPGGKITTGAVLSIVKRLGHNAGIKKMVSPHSFRHFYATYCMVNGIRLETLQYRLGHKSINSTMIYVHLADLVQDTNLDINPLAGVKGPYREMNGFVKAIRNK